MLPVSSTTIALLQVWEIRASSPLTIGRGTNWSTVLVAILEMGFMSNQNDDLYITNTANHPANGGRDRRRN